MGLPLQALAELELVKKQIRQPFMGKSTVEDSIARLEGGLRAKTQVKLEGERALGMHACMHIGAAHVYMHIYMQARMHAWKAGKHGGCRSEVVDQQDAGLLSVTGGTGVGAHDMGCGSRTADLARSYMQLHVGRSSATSVAAVSTHTLRLLLLFPMSLAHFQAQFCVGAHSCIGCCCVHTCSCRSRSRLPHVPAQAPGPPAGAGAAERRRARGPVQGRLCVAAADRRC